MNRSRLLAVVSMVLAACLVLGLASAALAQESKPEKEEKLHGKGWGMGPFVGHFGRLLGKGDLSKIGSDKDALNPNLVLAYISGKTGVSIEDLRAEYKSGKSLQEIAQAHGVDWNTLVEQLKPGKLDREKLQERLEQEIAKLNKEKERLQQQITNMNGRVSQFEQRIAGMEDGVLKQFALRYLEIMKEKVNIAQQQMNLLDKRLSLAQDQLNYVQSQE